MTFKAEDNLWAKKSTKCETKTNSVSKHTKHGVVRREVQTKVEDKRG